MTDLDFTKAWNDLTHEEREKFNTIVKTVLDRYNIPYTQDEEGKWIIHKKSDLRRQIYDKEEYK